MSKAAIVKYVFAAAVFIGGVGVLLYPPLSAFVNEQSQTTVITAYEAAVDALSNEDRAASLEAARSYNESLSEKQDAIIDPFGDVEDDAQTEVVSFLTSGEVMGYLQIPRIGIKVPVYEGTSEDILQNGIGWLKGTSLPVGGESTNSVLTGHRGLPTAKLFTELDHLEAGDEFYMRNSSEILAYKVIDTIVIDPNDTKKLAVAKGEDRMTLLTCHPYMVNSHRFLVIGERIPYTGQLDELAQEEGPLDSLTAAERDLAFAGLAVLACAAVLVLIIVKPWRRRKKR